MMQYCEGTRVRAQVRLMPFSSKDWKGERKTNSRKGYDRADFIVRGACLDSATANPCVSDLLQKQV